jgi:O-antigen/teichoic acid export membrane protein
VESSHPTASLSASETATALKNGIRLASSLVATWTVALVVRFQLPRMLGPEQFGHYSFCDAFTGSVFSLLGLGVGTYIIKEVAVRPGHASDFLGGMLLIRAVLGSLVTLGMFAFFHYSGRGDDMQSLMLAFALVHFTIGVNQYVANILQASSQVGALAAVNVAAKVIWGGSLMLALLSQLPLYMLALATLLSELIKSFVLLRAARSAVQLRLRCDLRATKQVVAASLPFFANTIALELGYRIDVTTLEFLAPGPEVGWYSAANSFAGLALLVSPELGWVVMPLFARASQRSEEEVFRIARGALRSVLMLVIPVTLGLTLMAELCVTLAFGEAFLPAVYAMQLLAPMFIATYVAIILANVLIVLERSWLLTTVSFIAVVFEAIVIVLVVPQLRGSTPGYVAAGAAFGLAASEYLTVALLLRAVGKQAFDAATTQSLLKCLALCIVVAVIDRSLLQLGVARFVVDFVVYVAGVFGTGAVRYEELKALVALVRETRASKAAR